MKRTWIASLLISCFAAAPALAHKAHCHAKGADGKLTDDTSVKDQKACEAKGQVWSHHHLHCHKAGADGKMADYAEAKTVKACEAAGGQWTDHGHEGLGD